MPQGALPPIWTRRLAAMCAALALVGCAAKAAPPEARPMAPEASAPAPAPAASPAYAAAAKAFAEGDYRLAAALFDTLAKDASDPALAQRAAYGQACSLLAVAETKDEFKAALAKWRQWEAMPARPGALEDPRMLGPVLKNSHQPGDNRDAVRPSKADADCAKRLADKEKEVRLLVNQIKALEKIHREIQERKKELSSP